MMPKRASSYASCIMAVATLLLPAPVIAAAAKDKPVIAIIIDDMGDKLGRGKRAIALPGKVTLSFLPHSPHAVTLADKAHSAGKEVMLHLPMESETGRRLGPGGLTLHMTEQELRKTTIDDLESIPHVKGINNHMGSLLTRHPGAMGWLMRVIKEQGGLYFVDSRTTPHSLAGTIAAESELSFAERDVFLDDVRDRRAIRKEFKRLLKLAKKRGYAIGIGHPYPETMEVLKRELAHVDAYGVRLVPVSQIVKLPQGDDPWHEPLYPSHKVVKSLKQ